MRDIISNDTLARIAKTVDEILDRMDSNTKRIEMPENIIDGDKVLFNYRQYDGVLYQVKVNDVNIIISDYTLDELLSDVHMQLKISKNKYVYVNIADKGFRMHGGSIEERTPTDYDVWIPDAYEFTNNGYAGRFTRDYYVPSEHTNIQYVQYLLVGLTVGEEYTFTFKSKIALHHSGTSVEWRDKPYGLLFAYNSTIDHEVVDVLPHDSGVWHSDVNFQSFYRDEQEHTYTCTFTPEYASVYITFIFDGVNSWDGYKSFTWSRFKSNKGVNILDKEICFEGTWYSLGANGGTSDLDAIELTYAEYQALSPAEKTDPDKIYFITDYPSGSGVVINPTGTATDTAETIEVDGTIYDFAGTDADAVHTADIGVAGGVAELDSNGKVPSAQLPTYPTVGDGTITIQKNGTNVDTFTTNQSSNKTVNITMSKSDVGLGNVPNVTTDNQEPTVTEASTRANIATGDTLKTIIGKIKKFFSDLKTVAFTGAYSDLSGTPTIPTVNNGTLTIKRNNTSVGTFTANQSGASNINIECATPSDVEGSKTATGSIVTVTDAAPIYAEEVDVAVECTQTGSGTPSPSNIRPIQGYDIVSVDRCGKNLFDGALKQGASSEYVINTNKLKVKPNTTYYWVEFNWSNSGSKQAFYYDLSNILISYENVSGNSFTTPANCVRVTIQHYKSGGLSVPTNPQIVISTTLPTQYEIYDAQTVSLQLGNKNLLPMTVEGIKAANTSGTWSGNVYTQNNVSFTVLTDENGCVTGIKANASTAASANTTFYLGEINKGDGDKYINGMPATGSGSTFLMAVYVPGGSAFSGRLQEVYGTGDTSFNGDSDSRREFIAIGIASGYTPSNLVFKPMLRKANIVDSTFSPYNPTLGGMVYGGQLTIKDDGSAVFVGDRACVDLGSLTWNYNSNPQMFDATIPNGKHINSVYGLPCSCSKYEAFTGNVSNLGNKQISVGSGYSTSVCKAVIKDSSYTDATTFKTAMSGVQLVYELATPFTLHLSAEQLKLLQGTNNVWSNAGNVTLKYQPDNVIAEPKADVQRLRDDVDDRLVGNACINRWNFDDYLNYCKTVDSNLAWTKNGDEYSINNIGYLINAKYSFSDVDYPVAISIKMKGNATSCYILGYDINGTEVKRVNVAINANTFTDIVLTANCSKVLISYGGSGGSVIIKNPQIEIGSSPSAYEEYYPSNRELASLVDSSLVKCNPTIDHAGLGSKLDISAYADDKPIFGYVYLAKGAYIRYCPVWLMKDWGTDEPSNTIITAHVTSYFKFTFYYNNSPRRVMLAEVKDYNDDDVSGYNAIRLYLYRNY